MPSGLDTSRTIPTSPDCYKVGTSGFSLAYSVEDQVEFGDLVVVVWDQVTGSIIWQRTYGFVTRQGQMALEGFVLPSYITLVGFQVTWNGSGSIFTRFNVFVVLDAPKAPMDPAWVSLLRYSCWWGRFKSNFNDAAQAITFGVFFQRPGFAYPRDTAARWVIGNPPTFMLKALLDKWNAGEWTKGNCVDVSYLTMLALCSVGLDFSTRQLTGSLLPPPPACGRSDCPPPWEDPVATEHFHTNDVCPIGSDPTVDWTYKWWAWAWHQICVLTGAPEVDARIWDPTAAQKEDLSGNGYRNPPADHPNHRWPQEDYWQKPRVWGALLGLVNEPAQGASDPIVITQVAT